MSGYSTVTSEPTFKVIAQSAPYCVFRNKEKYHFSLTNLSTIDGHDTLREHDKSINDQIRLFNDGISDAHVPSYLLYGTMRIDEITQSKIRNSLMKSTVAAASHNMNNLFVHTSGRYLDQIVLRDTAHTYNGSDLRDPPGFVLNISGGAAIDEIYNVGTTHFGYSTQLLARAGAEVFQLRTVGLDDLQAKQKNMTSRMITHHATPNVMTTVLDPVSKWQVPYEICNMSASSTGYNNASILTVCGRVCTWNPTDGVQFHSKNVMLPTSCLNGQIDYNMRISCTLHPQVDHILCDKSIYLYDRRTSVHARSLFTSTAALLSTAQHGSDGHCFVVSTHQNVSLVDARYPKTPIMQQCVPAGHTSMRFYKNPLENKSGMCACLILPL